MKSVEMLEVQMKNTSGKDKRLLIWSLELELIKLDRIKKIVSVH